MSDMRIDIHHHIHPVTDEAIVLFRSAVIEKLSILFTNMESIMASLDEVITAVAAEGTKIDSLTTLTAGLKQQLMDALAGVTLPPAVQAKVDAVFANVTANAQKVSDAIDANT